MLLCVLGVLLCDGPYYVALLFAQNPVPLDKMLSKEYAQHRAASITAANCTACTELQPLDQNAAPFATANTVYFSVIDSRGNGCSFINSNYTGFGTGIVPVGCGFTLQNRACNFSLDPSHPNCVAPGKKPYHTIIPALVTREDGGEGEGSLYAVLGVMGGFMQPQGHVQVLRNLLDFGMSPQDALDAPRWCEKLQPFVSSLLTSNCTTPHLSSRSLAGTLST